MKFSLAGTSIYRDYSAEWPANVQITLPLSSLQMIIKKPSKEPKDLYSQHSFVRAGPNPRRAKTRLFILIFYIKNVETVRVNLTVSARKAQ